MEHKKWETFDSNAEAKRRKAEIESAKHNGTFSAPSAKTVRELLADYMSIYGVNTWAMSTYESRKGLTSNYINPIIGDVKLADLNPHMMDKYYRELLKVRSVTNRNVRPKTVAEMLVERKKDIDEYKELFGEEFDDYGLVFCSVNGHPIERQVINRMFNKLIRDNGLPKVVFHSIRHTSITYKLKLNGGDMKSVQGDSGHAQMKMVADVHSHILDDDRVRNAQRIEETFYAKDGKQNDAPDREKAGRVVESGTQESDMDTLMRLLQKPEMAQMLKALAGIS